VIDLVDLDFLDSIINPNFGSTFFDREDSVSAFEQKGQMARELRRLPLLENLVLVFENQETLDLRVQEILKERNLRRARFPQTNNDVLAIETDTETENEIQELKMQQGRPGELACTLACEGALDAEHPIGKNWVSLSRHMYLKLVDGAVLRAHRISTGGQSRVPMLLQHLVFETDGQIPIALGCDHPDFSVEVIIPKSLSGALQEDMKLNLASARSM
jgi:hypothetical protein